MSTELEQIIQTTPLCDTHEHMIKEGDYVNDPPDILRSLFQSYVGADLFVAGARQSTIETLLDKSNPDVAARFRSVQAEWEAIQHTGYGEAVRINARLFYDIDEITPDALESAVDKHRDICGSGQRLRLLRDVANLDHVQTDDFSRVRETDESGPDFFLYDISWANFCSGTPDLGPLAQETGVEVHDLASLKEAMGTVFTRNADKAIAVKSQHAYNRTLRWRARSDDEAARALDAYLEDPEHHSEADRLCLGDWCWARGVELTIEHHLPFKLHTGYYAGHSRMPVDYIKSGNLCSLLQSYPEARFVLMHIAYPYSDELIALAKHYRNVYVDLCWAWSINPFASAQFLRSYIHAAPANKLFVFGGDTFYPASAVAYAQQTRRWLNRALQAEINDGMLNETQAAALARRFMYENQRACFFDNSGR